MMALPTITSGLRARSDRFGGGGTCSGSSAARGLRGEMGGLSLIKANLNPAGSIAARQSLAEPNACAHFHDYRRIRQNGGFVANTN
jgi:hypothetical protein